MAASYNDQQFLAADAVFQNRVRQSLLKACISITNEGFSVAFHRERQRFCVAVMNGADSFKVLVAQAVATDANVIADATANGTVALTAGNAAAQAANVTDAHMDTAIASQFNTFFLTPTS